MAKSTVRIIFFLFVGFYSFAQKENINKKDSAIGLTISDDESNDVRPVKVGWLFNAKDDPGFARIDLNDSDWIKTSSLLTKEEIEKLNFKGLGWFRYKLKLNSNEINVPNVIYIHHKGASEIYIDL